MASMLSFMECSICCGLRCVEVVTGVAPNVKLRDAERGGEAGMRSVPLERRVGWRWSC